MVRVYPSARSPKGLEGEALAEMGEMKDAGIVAVSDDGRPVMNAELMRRALEYARTFDLPVVQHGEDLYALGGRRDERGRGRDARRASAASRPRPSRRWWRATSSSCALDRRALPRRARLQRRSVRLVREAKRRGLPVTCEVTPHHLTLTDEACADYDTATQVNPPLRTAADVEALREALADGTIDAIATDHAPHSPVEKDVEFEQAAFGMIGLETALPLVLDLVRAGVLTPPDAGRAGMSAAPAASSACRAARSPRGGRRRHGDRSRGGLDLRADARFRSQSRNTPLRGPGAARAARC